MARFGLLREVTPWELEQQLIVYKEQNRKLEETELDCLRALAKKDCLTLFRLTIGKAERQEEILLNWKKDLEKLEPLGVDFNMRDVYQLVRSNQEEDKEDFEAFEREKGKAMEDGSVGNASRERTAGSVDPQEVCPSDIVMSPAGPPSSEEGDPEAEHPGV
jgi:hypothetical protein